jgi:hypothetical protein
MQKLEQTVASNARLEQELLVLRQKLQASRDSKNVQSDLGLHGQDLGNGGGATAALESGEFTTDFPLIYLNHGNFSNLFLNIF